MNKMIFKLKKIGIFLLLLNMACFNAIGQNITPVDQEVCKNNTATVELKNYFQDSDIKWQSKVDGEFQDIQNLLGPILELSDTSIQIVRCVVSYNGETINTNTSEIVWLDLPIVKFDIELPCTEQKTRFVISDKNSNIISYQWKVDNLFESVLESPEFIFEEADIYNVSLKITNDKSCFNTINSEIPIIPTPDINIIYDSIICGNSYTEFAFLQNVADSIKNYEWNISPGNNSFFEINGSNVNQDLKVNWGIVGEPLNLNLGLMVTNNKECFSTVNKQILLKTDIAPDFGIIFQKPYNSDVLIYRDDSDLNRGRNLKYQWGMDDVLYGEYFYCLFPDLNPFDNNYWVETNFDLQPTCKTRNYFDKDNFLEVTAFNNKEGIQVYPNPSVGSLVLNSSSLINKQIDIDIRDRLGSLVYQKGSINVNSEELPLNVNGLQEGFYLLNVICDNEKVGSTKFLIKK